VKVANERKNNKIKILSVTAGVADYGDENEVAGSWIRMETSKGGIWMGYISTRSVSPHSAPPLF
jgi:hypothetical protein